MSMASQKATCVYRGKRCPETCKRCCCDEPCCARCFLTAHIRASSKATPEQQQKQGYNRRHPDGDGCRASVVTQFMTLHSRPWSSSPSPKSEPGPLRAAPYFVFTHRSTSSISLVTIRWAILTISLATGGLFVKSVQDREIMLSLDAYLSRLCRTG